MSKNTHIRSVAMLACLLGAGCAGQPGEPKTADQGAAPPSYTVRPLKAQAEALAANNIKRVDTLLLPAMRKPGISCWVTMSREFNEDFVLTYIQDERGDTGGHRNAYVFCDDGSDRVKRFAIGTHLPEHSALYDKLISYGRAQGPTGPSLKPMLRQVIEEFKPAKIGINQSRTIPFCDGLTVEMKTFLVEALGPVYAARLVPAEQMIVDFLDTRLPDERPLMTEAADLTRAIHEEVLSNKAIEPGKSTVADVKWYVHRRLAELQVATWYMPIVQVSRVGGAESHDTTVIQPGDLVHTDIGVIYAGLYTDYQKNAYVLKPGETAAPAGLEKALANALRVQDAIREVARPGKIGYVVKQEAEALATTWGVTASVYSHSTGLGGHGIGAWMNPDWPDRYGVRATFPLRLGAYYSIESSGTTEVPEWGGQKVSIGTEENVFLTDQGYTTFYPRQEKLYIIKSGPAPK
jgi:Xaa-Pro aminopeptidase